MKGNDVPSQRIIRQPPSCIKFCPANLSMFVVGTYELDDSQTSSSAERTSSQSRSGQVELYHIRRLASTSSFGVSQCLHTYDFPDSAVLDLHFRPRHPTFFGVCTSTSHMIFFNLSGLANNEKGGPITSSILKVGSLRMGQDDTVLATSFAWNTQPNTDDPQYMSFAVAFSSGEVKLIGITRREEARQGDQYNFQTVFETSVDPGHALEAWEVAFADLAFGGERKKMLLTGGDDSILACHSIESNLDSEPMLTTQLFRDRKSHAAGVTAILPILDASQVSPSTRAFVTGSYDEHIRVFTIEESPPHKRQLVAELRLGGGVWRLGTLSQSSGEAGGGDRVSSVLVLASCMHAGVRIVRVTREEHLQKSLGWCKWKIDVVGQFTEGHESMCYGADSVSVHRLTHTDGEVSPCKDPIFQRQRSGSPGCDDDPPRDFVVVSTSFYDKKICVWSFRDDTPALGSDYSN